MRRPAGRTQPCSPRDARTRHAHARKFFEVAELVAGEQSIPESANVSAALAVLSGIAAADAACCKALGRRHRGPNHRDAQGLVEQITPGGADAAKSLARLLDLKDEAHYGLLGVGGRSLRAALRQASALVEFADDVLRR